MVFLHRVRNECKFGIQVNFPGGIFIESEFMQLT